MKTIHFLLIIAWVSVTLSTAIGQNVPIGDWKDYLSYQSNLKISEGQNTLYCTSLAGVFSYNLNDNSIQKFNRVTGLSDVSTSVARFNSNTNSLVIGYADGNIDILNNGQVTNVPALYTEVLEGSKTINDIYFRGDTAYLSCGQGILEMDINQQIILNTFNLSSSGSAMNVSGVTILGDSIFAAADSGVYKASMLNPNLNTFQSWRKTGANILPPGIYNCITSYRDSIFVNFSNHLTHNKGSDTIYSYSNGGWKRSGYGSGGQVNSLESTYGNLLISMNSNVTEVNSNGMVVNGIYAYNTQTFSEPKDALTDANGNIWIADAAHGLVESNANLSGTYYYPSGPFSNAVTSMAIQNNNIWITPGGYNQSHGNDWINNIGVSYYQNNNWYRIINKCFDINCIVTDPKDASHAFAGSWANGVLEYRNNQIVNLYNGSNSTLVPTYLDTDIRVGALGYDTLGNVWVACSNASSNYLSVLKPGGVWQAFDFSSVPSVQQVQNPVITQMLVTKSNAKWMIISGMGILVYQDNGTFGQPNAGNAILINTTKGNGDLPSSDVSAMAEDQNGSIWVGTNACVVVFYSPDNVLDGNHDWDADSVYVTQNGYTQVLMQNQTTTAIAVDGANRKWIGTAGGGVFLMSADGTQQIYNFTTANSPLISNNINCININPINGEVFIGTDQGIVSFRSTATGSYSSFTNVYAYPNPVPHGYDGVIAITGLVANSDVKITTINGQIVYHTTSLGGQAIWPGTNMSGERVQSGVYVAFCNSPDGTQSCITKILFLN